VPVATLFRAPGCRISTFLQDEEELRAEDVDDRASSLLAMLASAL
jgi:hypothetical protein